MVDDEQLFNLEELPTVCVLLLAFAYTAFLEDQINTFINFTFSKIEDTEKKWFTSLQKMPNGVIILDTKADQVVFQNQIVQSILGSDAKGILEAKLKAMKANQEHAKAEVQI